MIHNPANYAAGLLDERASAVLSGNTDLVAEIDAQIEATRAELADFDAAGLEEDQRAFVADVRRRMAAAEDGDFGGDPDASGAPVVHNPANYVSGLLDEREGAVRAGRTEVVADIDAELEKVAPLLAKFDVSGQDDDGAAVAHLAGVRRRYEAHRKGGAKAAAPKEASEDPAGKRDAKADAPPRTAAARRQG